METSAQATACRIAHYDWTPQKSAQPRRGFISDKQSDFGTRDYFALKISPLRRLFANSPPYSPLYQENEDYTVRHGKRSRPNHHNLCAVRYNIHYRNPVGCDYQESDQARPGYRGLGRTACGHRLPQLRLEHALSKYNLLRLQRGTTSSRPSSWTR